MREVDSVNLLMTNGTICVCACVGDMHVCMCVCFPGKCFLKIIYSNNYEFINSLSFLIIINYYY